MIIAIVRSQFQDIGSAIQMMKDMENMMNNNMMNEGNVGQAQGRHVQTIVTRSSDGTETTQTIETINKGGIPVTHVVVVKKNLKAGSGGPRINPLQMFAGINFLYRFRQYVRINVGRYY
jgi:hypothetical protein